MIQSTESVVQQAKEFLELAAVDPEQALALAKGLQKRDKFRWARQVLERVTLEHVADDSLRLKLGQTLALCTYKDPDLPAHQKLERALVILQGVDDLESTGDQESLGLAGSICKRMWELDTHQRHLERSLGFYWRGYRQGPRADFGYTGINAAYVLDLLAHLESTASAESAGANAVVAARRRQAREIREDLLLVLPPVIESDKENREVGSWWFLATLAEASFGLGRYDEARQWLSRLTRLPAVPDWEYETTAKQLASLARLHAEDEEECLDGSTGWQVLQEFLGDDAAAVRTAFAGKLGLGLSGGGFRASLFHIGVLARLAELDLLRHVHVLSCVSGGSILGAHYYLEVKKLLESKSDGAIQAQDYVDIVRRLSADFLAGVQRNIRTRVAGNPWVNLKMLFRPNYSRTLRIGELFESEIYSRIDDGLGGKPRYLSNLFIQPQGVSENFSPKRQNWRRNAKVPMLVLNATCLNTGHSWQFTASWMGESPAAIDTEIDGNLRLRRMYYGEAPRQYRDVRLGMAVAASACVPGLFEPIAIPDLYPGLLVRLVDGGVHDNQGIASLLEQDCTVLVVSDASGQMTTELKAKGGVLWPLLRSNSTLMARVRQTQFQDLKARLRSSLLKGLMILHLKKDLDVAPMNWVGCEEEKLAAKPAPSAMTRYGIGKNVQKLIANIRTDLDSFSEAEAFALMTSGYRQAEAFAGRIKGFPVANELSPRWPFLSIEKSLAEIHGDDVKPGKLERLLNVADRRGFKIWQLSAVLRWIWRLLVAVLILAFGWVWWRHPTASLYNLTVAKLGWILLSIALGTLLLASWPLKIFRYRQTLSRVGIALGMGLFGWIAAQIHLRIFDPSFLRRGRLDRFSK